MRPRISISSKNALYYTLLPVQLCAPPVASLSGMVRWVSWSVSRPRRWTGCARDGRDMRSPPRVWIQARDGVFAQLGLSIGVLFSFLFSLLVIFLCLLGTEDV
ncbi:hypothetical protein V8C42DRAFT_327906 [Trichoderma barbatum]